MIISKHLSRDDDLHPKKIFFNLKKIYRIQIQNHYDLHNSLNQGKNRQIRLL